MSSSEEIKAALIQLFAREVIGFDPDRPIAQQLDSLALFTVVPLIEKEFSVSFYSVELSPTVLHDIESLVAAIQDRKSVV